MNNEIKMRDLTPEELQGINDYLARTSKPTGLTVDDIIENRPTDKVISLAKEIFNIGYEAGVKATNVDCGVVWEERIDAIKKDIEEYTGYIPIFDSYGNGVGYKEIKLSADKIISIIDKHCGGDADE